MLTVLRIPRALCVTLLALFGAALLAGLSPAQAQVFNGGDLCHATSPQPKSADTLPTEFSCTGTPQAYQDGSLWLRIPTQDLPADIAEEPALLVHYSRFDRLDVTFLYTDGTRARESVRNGDFAGYWRIGGQLEFAPPVRTAPLQGIVLHFTRLASQDMLRLRLVGRDEAASRTTTLALWVGGALTLLLIGTLYNAVLAVSLRRQFPLWQAAWSGGMMLWGTIWSQAHLILVPGLAGAFSAQLCSALACLAVTCATFSAITSIGTHDVPRIVRRTVLTLATLCSLFGLPVSFIRTGPVDLLAAIIGVLLMLTMLSVGGCLAFAWRQGSAEARNFATAWIFPIILLSTADFVGSSTLFRGGGPQLMVIFAAAWQTLWLAAAASRTHARLRQEHAAARRAEAQARELARRDPLTSLRNRRGFIEMIEPILAEVTQGREVAALLLLDVDFFKHINDTYGHDTGDDVLVALARTLAARENARCIAARLGGEEFALLLSGPAALRAAMIAEDLRRTIASARPGDPDAGGTVLPPIPGLAVTVSIGVCPAIPGEVFRDLYRKADAALYRAKHEGRDRVILAAPGNDAPRDLGQLEPVPN